MRANMRNGPVEVPYNHQGNGDCAKPIQAGYTLAFHGNAILYLRSSERQLIDYPFAFATSKIARQ